MTKEAEAGRAYLHSAMDLMETAINAGITDPADLAAKLKLGQSVAAFLGAGRAAPRGVLLPPQFEKVLDKDSKHIITRDLTNGIEWDISDFGGKEFTAKQATAACKDLRTGGHADWRECSIRELLTTVSYDAYNPATFTEFFPNTKPGWYRTSTEYAPLPGFRWGVSFDGGYSGYLYDDDVCFVRAVRASQS